MSHLEKRLKPLLKSFVDNGVPGCSCMVTRDGKVTFEEYLGVANIETNEPITADTIYRIFSMTKVITCTAALILYERGFFLLNDPLEEYLPEFNNQKVYHLFQDGKLKETPAKKKITIKDLFTMTSGITYPGDGNETERMTLKAMTDLDKKLEQGEKINARSISKMVAQIPLAFEPGSQWHYGLSHDVLGALIEVVSGKTLSQFMKEEIFDPLLMENTFFYVPNTKKHRLCHVYMKDEHGDLKKDEEMVGTIRIDPGYESGGAGLFSTLNDYSRFAQMLANGGELEGIRIIGKKTVNLMEVNHLTKNNEQNYNWDYLAGYGYGLGVRVMENPALGGSNSSIGEFGWSGILGTWVSIDPKEKLAAVYMQQLFPNLEAYHQPRLRSVIYGAL